MTRPITAPATPAAGISTRAMLADLTISLWAGQKYDRRVSQEVADSHRTTVDAGRYNKQLIAKTARADLVRVERLATNYHHFVSLPWLNSGARIFPAALFFDYTQKMNGYQREFDAAADAFTRAYPQIIADAQRSLNGLFNAADYPDPRVIRSKFGLRVTLLPLPDAGDFRVDLGDADIARLQADFTRTRDELFTNAIREVVERIQEVVGRMAERLRAYKVTEQGTEGVFRDTLVTNVRDLAAVLPALNITANAQLEDLIDRIQASLCRHDAEILRENTTVREQTATAAEDILAHVSSFFA